MVLSINILSAMTYMLCLGHHNGMCKHELEAGHRLKMVKYVLTGATGGLGSKVFKHLIRLVKVSDVIVSPYHPAGATPDILDSGVEIRQGEFTKPETLDAAFLGGDKLLVVSCPSIACDEIRVKSHIAAINAAKHVGIKHVYYDSLLSVGESQAAVMQAHLDTKNHLKGCGLTCTVIREGIYSKSYPLYFGYWDPSRGREARVPYDDGGIAWVCRDNLGEGTSRLMITVRETYMLSL
ncbi:hypothetical protein BC835DRAFT_406627 [Cytidiella melzeri]|nr:hypothetical protein BC835DRAFT_406627 [Cytidiella melzeri]